MRALAGLARFIWDFVVGDDWRIAVGVAVAVGITAVVADSRVAAWWILPVGVAAVLGLSAWRAAPRGPNERSSRRARGL